MTEFRGVWLATVGNLDWPSAPGLDAVRQKAELLADFDLFQSLGLNAVIFQVRPCCDAFYESKIEPWSEFLTGVQGQSPGYDPLQFAIVAAHKRGMQLHAWINPFRARFSKRLSPPAPNHISVTHPHLVKDYGDFQWLDPSEPEAQERAALDVVDDILWRYDVDGIHIDDYFYPYKVDGRDFPDDDSWSRYFNAEYWSNDPDAESWARVSSRLSRDDWRRNNIDAFVMEFWCSARKNNPRFRLGISPFGIWRPENPPGIKGLDAFAELYADAQRWLQQGWADFFAPQLYWKIDPPEQSFPALLDWWQAQNPAVPIYPGLYTSRVLRDGWPVEEITRQIEITRERGTGGHIHFSARALRDSKIQEALRAIYQ